MLCSRSSSPRRRPCRRAPQALNVYAASSLRDAFPAITGSPSYNFGGSNTLQAQIERGGPADVFASASPGEARALFKEGLCSRPVTFATNKLVIIVPKGNPGHVRSVYSLRSGGRRVAIGTPGVPVGEYTRRSAATPAPVLDPALEHGEPGAERGQHHLEGGARVR